MYRTIAEFADDWSRESAISLKVQRALTDDSLRHRSDPESNSLGKFAWHMVVMIELTGCAAGLEVVAHPRGTDPPNAAASIADAYQTTAHSRGEQASTKLRDEKNASEMPIFGRLMSTARTLHALIRHQIHHRGQMALLMRQAGLIVPSVWTLVGGKRSETRQAGRLGLLGGRRDVSSRLHGLGSCKAGS